MPKDELGGSCSLKDVDTFPMHCHMSVESSKKLVRTLSPLLMGDKCDRFMLNDLFLWNLLLEWAFNSLVDSCQKMQHQNLVLQSQ